MILFLSAIELSCVSSPSATVIKSSRLPALHPQDLKDGLPIGPSKLDAEAEKLLTQMDREISSGALQDIHSLLIFHQGSLVYENYFKGSDDFIEFENDIKRNRSRPAKAWSQADKHYIASVNKGITSLLSGIALDQTHTPVTKPLVQCLPDYQKDFDSPEKRRITLADLLSMRSGFQWDEWTGPDLALLWHSDNFVHFLLRRNNKGPGQEWVYNSAGPNVLLHCLQNLLRQPLRAWADQNFFQKLGIKDYRWDSQADGLPEASARMFMRPRDLMKIGVLLLKHGEWQNRPVVPKAWIKDLFTTQAKGPAGDYSYLTWLRDFAGHRYLSFEGDGGQFLNVYPDEELIVVMNQGHYLDYPLWKDQMDAIQKKFILPAFAAP